MYSGKVFLPLFFYLEVEKLLYGKGGFRTHDSFLIGMMNIDFGCSSVLILIFMEKSM